MIRSRAFILMYTRSQNKDDDRHLFIVLTNPCEDKITQRQELVLLVNFTTVRDGVDYDDACIVEAGSHPFIKRKSYIFYKEARIEQALFIKNAIEAGDFIVKSKVSSDLYSKIVEGLYKSRYVARKYRRFFKQAYHQGACSDLQQSIIDNYLK